MKKDKQALIKNFKLLRGLEIGGAPRHLWRNRDRAQFLLRAENLRHENKHTAQASNRISAYGLILVSPWMRKNVFRPMLVGLSSFAVVFSGWIATVSASINSLPGDVLYPFKRVAEEAQLTLSPGAENKTKLQVEFASRRLEEVSKIAEGNDQEKKDKHMATTLEQFKNNIIDVKENLESLKDNGRAAAAVAVAKMVDRKVGEYASVLDKTETDLSSLVKENVETAKKAVEETGVKAVEVMAAHTDTIITAEELKKRLEDKIVQLENRISETTNKVSVSTTSINSTVNTVNTIEVKKKLELARTLVLTNDLRGALEEVKQATKVVFGETALTTTSTPVVTVVQIKSPTVTTTPRVVLPIASSSTESIEDMNVNIQFITDTTSLDWLEAQIMEQDFKPDDKPEDQDEISTIIK